MNACFSKPSPSHPAETAASFPSPEDLLDPATDTVDWLVPGLKPCLCFGFVPSPHTGGDDAWRSTLGAHRVAEMIAAIGAVGKHLARIVRQSIRASPAIVYVSWSYGNLLDKSRIRISTDMGFEAMNCWLTPMLDPMPLFVILTGGSDDGRIEPPRDCRRLELLRG